MSATEYLVSARDGEAYFYDVNALSNFVADAPNVIGFNSYVDLAEVIIADGHAGQAEAAAIPTHFLSPSLTSSLALSLLSPGLGGIR